MPSAGISSSGGEPACGLEKFCTRKPLTSHAPSRCVFLLSSVRRSCVLAGEGRANSGVFTRDIYICYTYLGCTSELRLSRRYPADFTVASVVRNAFGRFMLRANRAFLAAWSPPAFLTVSTEPPDRLHPTVVRTFWQCLTCTQNTHMHTTDRNRCFSSCHSVAINRQVMCVGQSF